jgi:hypothetical protein
MLIRALAVGMIAAFLGLPLSAEAQSSTHKNDNEKVLGGLNGATTAPTAGVGGRRIINNVGNDRSRTDSTMAPASGGSTGTGFTFPVGSVNLPTCGDPTATNFGQTGQCTYPVCGPKPADEVRNVGCPAGQTGQRVEARSYASQPAPTCWVAGGWAEIINTCTATCSTTQPAAETRTLACPVGQIGAITERRTYSSAPFPTCWAPSAWAVTSNSCVVSCGPQPANETRTLSCPTGQTGTIIESRSYTSAPHPTCWTPGAWTQTSNSCVNACPTQPATETRTVACPSGQTGTITESRSYVSAPAPTCWTAGTWQPTSNTCVAACPRKPLDETRTVSCPAGFTGTITESRTYTSAPSPTCWTAGAWTQTSSTCVASCGTRPDSEQRTLSCGTGIKGSITEQRDYFSAPAPTCWTAGQWYQVGMNCEGGDFEVPDPDPLPPPYEEWF